MLFLIFFQQRSWQVIKYTQIHLKIIVPLLRGRSQMTISTQGKSEELDEEFDCGPRIFQERRFSQRLT